MTCPIFTAILSSVKQKPRVICLWPHLHQQAQQPNTGVVPQREPELRIRHPQHMLQEGGEKGLTLHYPPQVPLTEHTLATQGQ